MLRSALRLMTGIMRGQGGSGGRNVVDVMAEKVFLGAPGRRILCRIAAPLQLDFDPARAVQLRYRCRCRLFSPSHGAMRAVSRPERRKSRRTVRMSSLHACWCNLGYLVSIAGEWSRLPIFCSRLQNRCCPLLLKNGVFYGH